MKRRAFDTKLLITLTDLPGEVAGASLKPENVRHRNPLTAHDLPGEVAGASLKLVALKPTTVL